MSAETDWEHTPSRTASPQMLRHANDTRLDLLQTTGLAVRDDTSEDGSILRVGHPRRSEIESEKMGCHIAFRRFPYSDRQINT